MKTQHNKKWEGTNLPPGSPAKVFGIIAEYNPLHNGHSYQIKEAKRLGATHIVVAMSPNFVQRGQVAIVDKFCRARAAVACGVDLVIELPTPYALSSAEKFAYAGIYMLDSMDIVDNLIFGSECGDIKSLEEIVIAMETAEFFRLLMFYLSQGDSFAKCRYLALERMLGTAVASIINLPNNILAIEYLKWLRRIDSKIKPITIKRKDIQHDSFKTTEHFSSASNLRNMIEQGCDVDKWKNFVPPQAFKIYSNEFKNNIAPSLETIGERAMLAMLRSQNIQDIRSVADISEGIEHRIMKGIQVSDSIEEMFFNIKTKRYAMSRIRRILYNAFLGISEKYLKTPPPYLRVLAANEKGIEIIRNIKKVSPHINIGTSLNKISKVDKHSKMFADKEVYATNMYSLFCNQVFSCNADYTRKFTLDKMSLDNVRSYT